MAKQGLLAQSRPAAATDTVLYRAPIDSSASTVLTIANNGTGSAYDVAVKDYDQKLTLDASTYKLHEGDLITSYVIEVNTSFLSTSTLTPGTLLTTTDKEKSFRFESFKLPDYVEIFVKEEDTRVINVESVTSGPFVVGNTISKGSGGDTTTATVFAVGADTITIGPSTINGSGTEFAAGDSISVSGGASATISTGGVPGSATASFIFSTTTAGGTYSMSPGSVFADRTYRFNVSDSSMSGRDFHLSTTINGEWGPDGTFGSGDDGTEYTTGKTTNGTAGSSGAYVQYAFGDYTWPGNLYYYDGGTGTASNNVYGGSNKFINQSLGAFPYDEIYVYDVVGTIVNSTDAFIFDGTTYTIDGQTSGAYGYVRDYTGTSLKFIKGLNSGDWSGSDTFRDVPKDNTADRTVATISSVDVAAAAVESSNYIVDGLTNGANEVDKITSLVVGPGETVVVNSATQNNVFSLHGFEDASTAIAVRVFGQS